MKTIISLLLGAFILVGLVMYLLLSPGVTTTPATTSEEAVTAEVAPDIAVESQEPLAGEGSLNDLAALNRAVECRISYDDPELLEPVIGTYFVSDGRVRGDFEMTVPELGGDIVSSIIIDDTTFYSWSRIDGQAYGIKTDKANLNTPEATNLSEPIPATAPVSYQCEDWSPIDGSVFIPPTDVLFQDPLSLQESGMEYGTIYEEGEF